MVYAYDQWAQMPIRDLYDTQMMLASVNAAKDMYEKAAQEMKEFKKEYGDFYTPIAAQQEWYNKEFNAADKLNEIYSRGGDPLRNRGDRMELISWINSRPYTEFAQAKRDYANVQKFLDNAGVLDRAGLYNDELTKYQLRKSNPGVSGDTIDEIIQNWNGPFNLTSPTPYKDMADFSKSYFDGIQPNTSVQTKNGVSYTSKDVTIEDLRRIADDSFNDLVKTQQGQLMYNMFLDQTGGDEDAARQMFNNTVVSGNLKRLHHEDDYVQNLNTSLQRQLNRDIAEMRKEIAQLRISNRTSGSGRGSGSGSGGSKTKDFFTAQKAMQAVGTTQILRGSAEIQKQLGVVTASDFNPAGAEGWIQEAQKDIFGSVFNGSQLTDINRFLNARRAEAKHAGMIQDRNTGEYFEDPNWSDEERSVAETNIYNALRGKNPLLFPRTTTITTGTRYFNSLNPYSVDNTSYKTYQTNNRNIMNELRPYVLGVLGKMSTEFTPADLATFVQRDKYDKVSGDWFQIKESDINRIYIGDDAVANMEGSNISPVFSRLTKDEQQEVRDLIKSKHIDAAEGDGFILTPMMKDGKQHIFAKIRLGKYTKGRTTAQQKDMSGNVKESQLDDKINTFDELDSHVIYLDLGVNTVGNYSLIQDENLSTMSGSNELNKKFGVSKNNYYSDENYITPYSWEEDDWSTDDFQPLVQPSSEAAEYSDEDIERMLNGTY